MQSEVARKINFLNGFVQPGSVARTSDWWWPKVLQTGELSLSLFIWFGDTSGRVSPDIPSMFDGLPISVWLVCMHSRSVGLLILSTAYSHKHQYPRYLNMGIGQPPFLDHLPTQLGRDSGQQGEHHVATALGPSSGESLRRQGRATGRFGWWILMVVWVVFAFHQHFLGFCGLHLAGCCA